MARTVGIGIQSFDKIRENNYFYIDKTSFIKEWWESGDDVTLITRPRRFGKTLNMSMAEDFFSIDYANRGDLFEGLSIWEEEKYRKLQGTYPVISLSFASVKERNYESTKSRICQLITDLYNKYNFIKKSEWMTETDKDFFDSVRTDMPEVVATIAIYKLSYYLYRYYGKKVIILLDEYDTPMQEAYVDGFWDDLVGFTRSMFNTSNRESGFGRYDVMLEPRNPQRDDAIILEFKVYDPEDETTLKDTVQDALKQIEVKQYAAQLIARGIPKEHIRNYGFAFHGKNVLIG